MTKKIHLPVDGAFYMSIVGDKDNNINLAEKYFGVKIILRGEYLNIYGDEGNADKCIEFFTDYFEGIEEGRVKEDIKFKRYITDFLQGFKDKEKKVIRTPLITISTRTKGQNEYVEAIEKNVITFSIGPAGTGKTYLAVAKAIESLMLKKFSRIILVRPAVEAGESIGFLPGDFKEKVDPYLRPLYDALFQMISFEKVQRYIENGIIEIAPLGFMRGRTLNNAFVILDEAQNTTHMQMKMFLTRIGENSRAVVTGDITQVDLIDKAKSGLIEISYIIKDIKGVSFVYLKDVDVIRHPLVQNIVKAYQKYEEKNSNNK